MRLNIEIKGETGLKKKAVALLSGGLDSTLAVKTMIDQGVEVIALNFTSPFCNCTQKNSGCDHEASRVAKELGVEIKVISKGLDYINNIVRNPKHGMTVSELLSRVDDISEIDLNPVIAYPQGLVVVDAKVLLSTNTPPLH